MYLFVLFSVSVLSGNLTRTAGLQSLSCGNNAITELPASIQSLVQALVALHRHSLWISASFTHGYRVFGCNLAERFAAVLCQRELLVLELYAWQVSLQKLTLSSNKLSAPYKACHGHFLKLQRNKRSSDADN